MPAADQRDVGRRLGHDGTSHWTEFTSGASCEENGCTAASSSAECEAAAQELVSKSMFHSFSSRDYPAGCFNLNGNFYYNTFSSSATCSSPSHVCVCYCSPSPSPPPSMLIK